jgi:Domain of unknown function (DUF6875)
MPAQTTNLFLLEDLEDSSRTSKLADSDLDSLRIVTDWINTFITQPHQDLGRSGPVCPFVPGSLERKAMWLAPEHIANKTVADLVQLVNDYEALLLRSQPSGADDAIYKAILVVFTDVSADRANDDLNDVHMQDLNQPAYADDGVVLGQFHERNEGSAVRNPNFHPFRAPIPFLLMRLAVTGDWVFFLDNEDWFNTWARRWGESAVQTLADELRLTNWRSREA